MSQGSRKSRGVVFSKLFLRLAQRYATATQRRHHIYYFFFFFLENIREHIDLPFPKSISPAPAYT